MSASYDQTERLLKELEGIHKSINSVCLWLAEHSKELMEINKTLEAIHRVIPR